MATHRHTDYRPEKQWPESDSSEYLDSHAGRVPYAPERVNAMAVPPHEWGIRSRNALARGVDRHRRGIEHQTAYCSRLRTRHGGKRSRADPDERVPYHQGREQQRRATIRHPSGWRYRAEHVERHGTS